MSQINDFDNMLSAFSTKLRDDLGIEPPASLKLASYIRDEIRSLPLNSLPTLSGDSPLALKDRWEMLNLLVNWLIGSRNDPNTYGQILSLNYIAFVYLGDTTFKVLRKELTKDTVCRKCCVYLTDNPVRAFRNAIAHGNWRFAPDGSAIDFWARKGDNPGEDMVRWRLTRTDLRFCQSLALATAYATMLAL
jgi:hypothetical protein